MSQLDPLALSVVGTSERELSGFISFLDFYCGVFSLVALSLTVMGGVVAMDRTLLQPRHRLQAQLLHRAVALASVGFLMIHVTIRVVEGHVTPLGAAVPFLGGGPTTFVGLGTIAAYLMLLLTVTGVARGRFASRSRPTLWRAIHWLAYLAWPVALFHGLQAGRTPKPWVLASYQACVALVVLALLVRLITRRRRKVGGKRRNRGVKEVKIPRPDPRPRRTAAAPPARFQAYRPEVGGPRNATTPREAPRGRRPDAAARDRYEHRDDYRDGYRNYARNDPEDSGYRRRR